MKKVCHRRLDPRTRGEVPHPRSGRVGGEGIPGDGGPRFQRRPARKPNKHPSPPPCPAPQPPPSWSISTPRPAFDDRVHPRGPREMTACRRGTFPPAQSTVNCQPPKPEHTQHTNDPAPTDSCVIHRQSSANARVAKYGAGVGTLAVARPSCSAGRETTKWWPPPRPVPPGSPGDSEDSEREASARHDREAPTSPPAVVHQPETSWTPSVNHLVHSGRGSPAVPSAGPRNRSSSNPPGNWRARTAQQNSPRTGSPAHRA